MATVGIAFPSDACDPSWSSMRDGLIGTAFGVSMVAFISGTAMVWTHIYYHKGKEILGNSGTLWTGFSCFACTDQIITL